MNGKALTRDIYITSQDIFNGQAIAIPERADLNDYQTPGLYYQGLNVQAESGSNYPESLAGSLVVLQTAGVTQRYFVYNSSRIYTRSLYSWNSPDAVWSPWAREYNTLNKPTVSELGLAETVNKANGAVPSSRKINGKALTGDISLSAGDVGACRAYSGTISIGGRGMWSTAEFLQWLKSQGAFDNPYWMCKGSWSYASNRIINDTGCGNICLAGAVVEVMGVESAITIRVTTPTTADSIGIPSAQFTYINHGEDYRPGWRRDYNTANKPTPVGAPIPWPQPNPPSGYLACNGQTFDKSRYPQLAEAYPSGKVPDLRGEFIRGWDDGRGVDSGRGILSWQPQQVQWHQHIGGHGGRARGAFGVTNQAGHPGSYHDDGKQTLPFTNNGSDYQGFSNNGAVGNETRPRNIAFNYIVRAA